MKTIIEENYKSIVGRGLITPTTTINQFIDKLYEEVAEFEEACNNFIEKPTNKKESEMNNELADVILVALNIAKHYNIDIEKELKNKIKKNYERAGKNINLR